MPTSFLPIRWILEFHRETINAASFCERNEVSPKSFNFKHPVTGWLHTPAEIKCLWFISISREFSLPYGVHLQKVPVQHTVHYCQNKQNLFLQKVTYMQDTCICHNSILFLWYAQCSLHPKTLQTFHLPWTHSDLHITSRIWQWNLVLHWLENLSYFPLKGQGSMKQ